MFVYSNQYRCEKVSHLQLIEVTDLISRIVIQAVLELAATCFVGRSEAMEWIQCLREEIFFNIHTVDTLLQCTPSFAILVAKIVIRVIYEFLLVTKMIE